jgi:hypothetical protein
VTEPKKSEKAPATEQEDEKAPATEQEDEKAEDSPEQQAAEQAAEKKFVEDTLIRGEAAEADEKGELPPDATHEIVEENEGEPPTIRRRRFKAF